MIRQLENLEGRITLPAFWPISSLEASMMRSAVNFHSETDWLKKLHVPSCFSSLEMRAPHCFRMGTPPLSRFSILRLELEFLCCQRSGTYTVDWSISGNRKGTTPIGSHNDGTILCGIVYPTWYTVTNYHRQRPPLPTY